MIPTIRTGSLLKITKQSDLDYGDIVVFNFDGRTDDDASEEIREYRKKTGADKIFEIHGPLVSRIVGLPGDSIAVEKEVCIINGKKNKHRLIGKTVPDEDLEEFIKDLIFEHEEFLPNGKNIRIYRFELTDEYFKKRDYYKSTNARDYKFPYDDMDAIKIPGNHYFLMGDFRSDAIDSRKIGTISREQIFGKVVKIKPPKKK